MSHLEGLKGLSHSQWLIHTSPSGATQEEAFAIRVARICLPAALFDAPPPTRTAVYRCVSRSRGAGKPETPCFLPPPPALRRSPAYDDDANDITRHDGRLNGASREERIPALPGGTPPLPHTHTQRQLSQSPFKSRLERPPQPPQTPVIPPSSQIPESEQIMRNAS